MGDLIKIFCIKIHISRRNYGQIFNSHKSVEPTMAIGEENATFNRLVPHIITHITVYSVFDLTLLFIISKIIFQLCP